MPELPEVETTRRGISPALERSTIREIIVRNASLRWPVPDTVQQAAGQSVVSVRRRAKYLLVELSDTGGLLMHLGMSGSMRVCAADDAPRKHDHVDIVLDSGQCVRFNDPRRFGALLWWEGSAEQHELLAHLGPEPLSEAFSGAHLRTLSRGRRGAVKNFIMDGRVVVGVGNIYASEALFMAGIHPARPAGRVSLARYEALAAAIKDVLATRGSQGRNDAEGFRRPGQQPGLFCPGTAGVRPGGPAVSAMQRTAVRKKVIGQRSSYYCPRCQR